MKRVLFMCYFTYREQISPHPHPTRSLPVPTPSSEFAPKMNSPSPHLSVPAEYILELFINPVNELFQNRDQKQQANKKRKLLLGEGSLYVLSLHGTLYNPRRFPEASAPRPETWNLKDHKVLSMVLKRTGALKWPSLRASLSQPLAVPRSVPVA